MIRVEGTRSDIYDPTTGEHSVVMDLQVSSSADLPEKDSLVGAAANGTWYTGMLDEDNVHPTEAGAIALYHRAIADCPELTYPNP